MIFTCSNCGAQYKISDDRIPAKGAKVKCKKCGNIITIKAPETNIEESESFQNEATVVQKSPFAQEEEATRDSTRVVSAEQAAGIFKNLIEEHSQEADAGSNDQNETPGEAYQEDSASQPESGDGYSEHPDDRLTSVYEDRASESSYEETEQEVNNIVGDTAEEEDISREATRVVSTEQLKQMAGEEETPSSTEQDNVSNQGYYSQSPQPYVAPRSRGEWYVAIGQMQVGPLSLNEVEEKWGRGEINSTTLVWKAGMAGWQPLMYVPELSHLVPPAQESRVEEQPPVKEFATEPKEPEPVFSQSSASAFPSLDELTKQEEELKSQKEEPAVDWKPAAGEALASLVQDEMESMQRGFSTDIPISTKSEEKVDNVNIAPPESPVLPFEKAQDAISSPPVSQSVSTPPVVVEQPVIVNTPYQPSYPPVYPNIYSQPPQKVEKKSYLVPILIAVFGLILIIGGVFGYLLYSKLAGEKVVEKAEKAQVQPQQAQPQQAQPQQPQQQPNQPAQPQQPTQQQADQQPSKMQEPQKQEELAAKVEQPKEEKAQNLAQKESKKESQKQRVAQKEEKVEKPSKKQAKTEDEEMPPPPKEEKKPKKEEVAKAPVEPEPPKKQKPSKGSDALLDFEGEGSSKGSSGGLPKTLSQEQILEVVKANIGRIKTCMAEQAQRDSSVKGKLIIGWEIQPNGKTKNVQIKTPQFKGTYIGTCISSVVTDFSFPKFSGPPIPIEFPFNIK